MKYNGQLHWRECSIQISVLKQLQLIISDLLCIHA